MAISGVATGALGLGLQAPAVGKNGKATEAAGQFESLLIAQMLKSMREEGSGWLGTGEDKSFDSAMGMAEEHLASAISSAGGFGLAKIVNTGLQAPGVSGGVHALIGGEGVRGESSGGNDR